MKSRQEKFVNWSLAVMLLIASLCIFFVNNVREGEFAIYEDDGKFVLQPEGSGIHFGLYNAVYFETSEKVVYAKKEITDVLGRLKQKSSDCYAVKINPKQLATEVLSLKDFSPENYRKDYNTKLVRDYSYEEITSNNPPTYLTFKKIN